MKSTHTLLHTELMLESRHGRWLHTVAVSKRSTIKLEESLSIWPLAVQCDDGVCVTCPELAVCHWWPSTFHAELDRNQQGSRLTFSTSNTGAPCWKFQEQQQTKQFTEITTCCDILKESWSEEKERRRERLCGRESGSMQVWIEM